MEPQIVYQMSERDVKKAFEETLKGEMRKLLYAPLNVREIPADVVAGMIGRSVDTVNEYGKNGILPSRQPAGKGGIRLFPMGDVLRFILENPQKGRNIRKEATL